MTTAEEHLARAIRRLRQANELVRRCIQEVRDARGAVMAEDAHDATAVFSRAGNRSSIAHPKYSAKS